jgi:protein O-GlcNAc transferase
LAAKAHLAWATAETGDDVEALRHYRDLLEHSPDYADGRLALGAVLARMNQHDDAIAELEEATSLAPSDARIYFHLAASYLARGRIQDALMSATRAVNLEPNRPDYIADLGVTLGELGHWDHAAQLHRQALSLASKFEHAYNLGIALNELGEYADAEQAFRRALALQRGPTDAKIRLALTLRDQGRYGESLDILRTVPETSEEAALALPASSDILLSAGRRDEAIRIAQLAIERFPQQASSHAALAWALIETHSAATALPAFEKAIQLIPECTDYIAGRAVALSDLGRHAEAILAFEDVEARDSDYLHRHAEAKRRYEESRAALFE